MDDSKVFHHQNLHAACIDGNVRQVLALIADTAVPHPNCCDMSVLSIVFDKESKLTAENKAHVLEVLLDKGMRFDSVQEQSYVCTCPTSMQLMLDRGLMTTDEAYAQSCDQWSVQSLVALVRAGHMPPEDVPIVHYAIDHICTELFNVIVHKVREQPGFVDLRSKYQGQTALEMVQSMIDPTFGGYTKPHGRRVAMPPWEPRTIQNRPMYRHYDRSVREHQQQVERAARELWERRKAYDDCIGAFVCTMQEMQELQELVIGVD